MIFFFFFASENFSKQRYPVSNPENIVQVALLTFFSPKEIFFSFRKHFSYLVEKVQQLPSFFFLFKKSKETNCQEKGGRKLSLMKKKMGVGRSGPNGHSTNQTGQENRNNPAPLGAP